MANREPPALPGEVWRGVDAAGDPWCITEDGDGGCTWRWVRRKWQPAYGYHFMAKALLAERARAERAEAIAAAERRLREALFVGYSGPCDEHIDAPEDGCFDCDTAKAINAAAAALRALGVEP